MADKSGLGEQVVDGVLVEIGELLHLVFDQGERQVRSFYVSSRSTIRTARRETLQVSPDALYRCNVSSFVSC